MLTDDILREAVGPELMNQAYLALASGHVIQRMRQPDGEISARWDSGLNSPLMRVRSEEDRLLTLCNCPEFQRDATCAHIAALLVAWAGERPTFVPVGAEEVLPGELPSGTSVQAPTSVPVFDVVGDYRRILNMFTVTELREIARLRKVPISGIRKDPIVDALAQALAQKDKFRADWPLLSPQARLLAGLLPFIVTFMNIVTLEQTAQPLGVNGNAFTQAIEELRSFGLIAIENYGGISYPSILPIWAPPDPDFTQVPVLDVKTLRIQPAPDPQSFYQAVTRLLILLQSSADTYQARVDVRGKDALKKVPMLREWPMDQHDVDQLVQAQNPYQFVKQEGVHITSAPSLLTNEARQKLATAIQAAPEQVDFAFRLLQSYNLVLITPGKPVRPAPGVIASILQMEEIRFLKQLIAGYANLNSWSEIDLALAHPQSFRLILSNYNQGSYTRFIAHAGMLREKMILLLRRLPAGQWYALDGLARRASLFPLLPLLRNLLERVALEINGRKINLDRAEDIQALYTRFIECMLSGPLYWQGAVDLAWEKDRLVGFRITDLGAALLAQPVDFQMPEPAEKGLPLEFTPEGNLILHIGTASSSLIGLAILLGEVDASRQGGIIIRPSLAGVGRAFEASWSAERILETLAAEAGRPVPPALAELLNQWWQNFGSVQIYQDVALMEFGDDYVLGELLAGTSLPRYLLFRFSPRLIAIRPEGAVQLRDELVKKGYTPKSAD
jgi:hypothetical protein